MVTVSILFNPGMSKMRERERQRGNEKAGESWQRGTSEPALNFSSLWARASVGLAGVFIPGGRASRGEDEGRAWVLRATGEPTEKAPGFA